MDNEKGSGFPQGAKEEEFSNETTTRARNRTVMLTPEITDQVRARLAKEVEPAPAASTASTGQSGRTISGAHAFGSTYAPASAGFQAPSAAAAPHPSYMQAVTPPAAHDARSSQGSSAGTVWSKQSPIVGFLVSFDTNPNGDVYEVRVGRLIVTSEAGAGGNVMLINDASVSPMHAIMRITAAGEIQVLDQLSEHGTKIRKFGTDKEEQLSGDKASVEHGDVLFFGQRSFHVCIVVRGSDGKK